MNRRRPTSQRPSHRAGSVLVWLVVPALALGATAGPVVGHGGATGSGGGASLVASTPRWVGAAVGLALVAGGILLVGRALGRATRLAGVVAVALLVGSVLIAVVGATGVGLPGGPAAETPLWVSDTGREIGGNHHAPAVADGRVYAPLSGPGTPAGCELVALHAADGGVVWRAPVETNCTIHAVADPAVADTDGDGREEVLVATTEEELRAYSRDGDLLRTSRLADYGYTRPVVADLDGDGDEETVVVDVRGTVVVLDVTGEREWEHRLDDYVWARPVVDDVDGDGENEVFVAQRDGTLTLLGSDGETEWTTTVGDSPAVSWLVSGQVDGDPALELVVATVEGGVHAVDGRSGQTEWSRNVGSLASVGGLGDGDGDGESEVYVADNSGTVRALDAATGETEWSTRVTDGSVQMMPPPSFGDTDGDGSPDLVVPAHDGTVSKLDPADGRVVARYTRDVDAAASDNGFDRIFARATLGDVDGDGDDDAVVIYADGTVVALDF